MATTTPNFGWPVPTSTDLVKNGATAIEALGDSIDASMLDLKGGTTGQVLSKTTNTDMDFTWVTTDDANAIQNSIVDAKGDLISATANDTPARLAVGSNGETLVADSSTSTGLRYQASMAAGRNGTINGGMDIWQRGTSISLAANTTSANGFNTDRWFLPTGTNQASTVSRQSVSDSTNLPNIQYCARVQRNSGQTGTAQMAFNYNFETANSIPFAGKTITVSFYARAGANYSPTSSVFISQLYTGTGTDQNIQVGGFTGQTLAVNQSNTLTTTWQRFSYTYAVPGTVTQFAYIFLWTPTGTAGANDYFEMTGVQMELGSVATNFSRTGGSIQGELAACQRYYVSLGAGDFYGSYYNASSQFVLSGRFPVTMRTTPTATLPSGTVTNAVQQVGVANYNASTFAAFAGATNSFSFTGTATGGTIYAPVAWLASDTTTFSAEL